MSLSLFIARRIYRESDGGKQVSRPAVLIAMAGIAIGLAVMIIAVAVVIGFKSEVRNKVIGFESHIQITNLDAVSSYETHPIVVGDSMMTALADYPEISHVQRFSTKPGMIKTDDAFQGMVLKGVGPEFDPHFIKEYLVEGEIPVFSDSVSSNQVLISKALATKMKLKLGDKIYTYYIQDDIRARRIARAGDGLQNQVERLFFLGNLRRKAALVAHARGKPLLFEQRRQRVIGFRAHPQRRTEILRADGHDHKFLHVQPVSRVRAAVENVHHRHGRQVRLRAAQKAEQRHALRAGSRLGAGHRHGQRRVRAENGLVFRAVQRNQRLIDGEQVVRVHAAQGVVDGAGDVFAGLQHAFAAVKLHIAVAQFQRLVFAGGCAAGRDGRAGHAAG